MKKIIFNMTVLDIILLTAIVASALWLNTTMGQTREACREATLEAIEDNCEICTDYIIWKGANIGKYGKEEIEWIPPKENQTN